MYLKTSLLQKYAVAAVVVLIAFVLRYAFYDTLDHRLPFAFFLPATIIAAWFGGLGPGLFAAVAGLLLGDYFFLPKHDSGDPMTEPERAAIGLYAMNSVLIVILFWRLHMRLRELNEEVRKLKNPGQSAR
jgi:K+-sensing histidine kinase KdpD